MKYKRIETVEDLARLIALYEEVFEMKNFTAPGSEHLETLVGNRRIVFLAAYLDGRMLGGLTAYVMPSVYAVKPEMYLYDLAVKADFQRQGVGRGLLEKLKEVARELNVSEFYVQADIVDDGALAFYRGTGGIEEDVRHFGYPV